jgi:RimJ/RimL family protein N-acetyltransferase
MIAPTLTTPRLTLRMPIIADYQSYAAFMASERSTYMGGPFDEFGAWALFCHDVGQWAIFGLGGLMIDLSQTGETVGAVGINQGPLFPEPELGWFLYAGHEGNGYATEAAMTLRHWAQRQGGLSTLVSYMDPENIASARVAQRLGAELDPLALRQKGDETDLVYRHQMGRVQ